MRMRFLTKRWLALLLAFVMTASTAALVAYASADELPDWFTYDAVHENFLDENLAQAVYAAVVAATTKNSEDAFSSFNASTYGVNPFPEDVYELAELITYINADTSLTTDAEKTAKLLNYYTGNLLASGNPVGGTELPNAQKIKDITGITLLGNAKDIDLSNNLIESLRPISGGNTASDAKKTAMFRNGINFQCNPIHEWPAYLAGIKGSGTYNWGTAVSVYGASPLKYHYGDTATAKIALGVKNVTKPNYIWDVTGSDRAITGAGQTEADGVSIGLDTIEGGVATLTAKIGQGVPPAEDVIGRYYTNVTGKATGGTLQQNTLQYTWNLPVQLYAGVKQTANAEAYGGFTFTKTDKDTAAKLSGAVYKLYKVNADGTQGDEVTSITSATVDKATNTLKKEDVALTAAMLTTDEDGILTVNGLPAGSYMLVEQTAPEGYIKATTPVAVTVTAVTLQTTLTGGIESFGQSDKSVSMVPDWSKCSFDENKAGGAQGNVTTGSTLKTAADYNSTLLVTNQFYKGYDADGKFSERLKSKDYAEIKTLTSELPASQTGNYNEISVITLTMANEPTVKTFSTLAAAKNYINNTLLRRNNLKGDIIIESDTVYMASPTALKANGVGQTNKSNPKPPVPTTGSLTISKTVTGKGAPAEDEFIFTVTFSDGGTYDGVASGSTITLKDGEARTITGIPLGVTYTVVEKGKANYMTTPANRTQTGSIVANTTATAAFRNAYEPYTEVPQTGDDSKIALWLALTIVSFAGLIVFNICGKKKPLSSRRSR